MRRAHGWRLISRTTGPSMSPRLSRFSHPGQYAVSGEDQERTRRRKGAARPLNLYVTLIHLRNETGRSQADIIARYEHFRRRYEERISHRPHQGSHAGDDPLAQYWNNLQSCCRNPGP